MDVFHEMHDFFRGAKFEDLFAWAVAVTLYIAALAYVAQAIYSAIKRITYVLSVLPGGLQHEPMV